MKTYWEEAKATIASLLILPRGVLLSVATQAALGSQEPSIQKAKSDTDPRVYQMSHDELTKYKEEKDRKEREEKIKENRERDQKAQQEADNKHQAYVELEDKIIQWSGPEKNRNNIRTMLCTL
eukprot:CAMPEP_0114588418 /NCGR_PEP_ID=MMETSP0125-20121206/11125_1 /TAXON_ID=485358 ORGANISM="Aristerostoma sp., Strain ATCC 50986" /NCGR_SAMPLE_ID=MMETSP0125 /ASSEMBLY_ACC=CAM_ASM_000245 /LENGTH=122 /DNA_ID=CAMNT_0001784803 /DNA_START=596 /DNA_END=963 /DNA_ORIENTATION=-